MSSIAELQREFARRAADIGLKVDCLGDGDVDAKICVIVEAPGETETKMRTPLIGRSGAMLWEALRKFGIQRRHCYITNVVKRQLLSANLKEKVPANELAHWHGLLEWELAQLKNVQFVLVLGDMALHALSGQTGIEEWRGNVLNIDGKQYVITVNPAYLLRTPLLEAWFMLDLAKLDMCVRGTFREHHISPIINPSPDEAIRYIGRMLDERRPIAFDIETMASETACVGLANSAHEGMCINFRDAGGNRFSVADECRVRRAFARLFSDPEARFVAQNGNFDSYWLWYKDRLRVRRVWFDTLLAHHLIYPPAPHDLGFLTTQYTTHPYYKNERTQWKEHRDGKIEDFWVYNVKDCALTWAVHEKLHKELIANKLDNVFFNHIMRAQPHLTAMTVCGVLVDVAHKQKFDEEYTRDVDQLESKFVEAARRATGDPAITPNPRSPNAVRDLLFNKLRLTGRGLSTDANNRKHILANPRTSDAAKEVILSLARYKEVHKFHTTYVKMRLDPDNRVRTEYKQFGTQSAPGRLSSASNMWGSGMNMQNQPPKAREMFIADEGFTWVYYDLSQAEARLVAWFANIRKWKEQFTRSLKDNSFDCHRALCSEMFKIPYDETPKKDTITNADGSVSYTKRYIAKRCRHGLNYRMGADRLAEVTGLPYAEAVHAYNLYHSITPELRQWWDNLTTEVKRTHILQTPYGRVWRLLARIEDDSQLEAIVAFLPQSTVGDKNTEVIYQCHEDPDWPKDARIMLNVHDSLTALVPIGQEKRVGAIMKKHAEKPIYIRGEAVIIPAEVKWTPSHLPIRRWSHLEPLSLE